MKGAIAKESVTKKITEVFGKDFVGIADKKIYILADDGGEKVQIAISMTCPKKPIGEIPAESGAFSTGEDNSGDKSKTSGVDLSEEEQAQVNKIMSELGL